ncbi:hypothetical protein JCGZ_26324 [Jatropha curcas]|uniref:Uncharacterized protein n=1 Tax=Jatropha curcas TaxID=180498 RepID=A0A067JI47_JATCU|nr:light-harvesting complex-like protein 3 isotype 1, chloroplastic [Jatropha curcas]KDP22493.1 hypothetical protein JCGZ_26324 [Jatropha curcas]
MASISISLSASLQSACSSHHFTKKQQPQIKPSRSLGSKQVTHVVTLNVEDQNKGLSIAKQQENPPLHTQELKSKNSDDKSKTESSAPKFIDKRWKKGTWDLNMFVKDGNMDWDGLIEAEAKRRKFLELYPEASTNEEPVLFRSSIIPWWAWLKKSYLPEAELLNGRAAMVGFFMSYVVDTLTGIDMVGQTGNLICKAGLFVTVISIILLRRTDDFQRLRNLADEATLYDKQWQASWQDQDATSSGVSEKNGN